LLILFVEAQAWTSEIYGDNIRFILVPGVFLAVLASSYALARLEHRRLRSLGYLRFYIQANKYIRVVFFVVTLANSVICVIFTFYPDDWPVHDSILILFLTIEMGISLVYVGLYVKLIWIFNKNRTLPDAHAWQQSQGLPEHELAGGARVHATGRDIVQKQALMIRHLEKQLRTVNEELQKLKHQTKYGHMARRSDFDSLLNAKDNEIRTLKVERDRLNQYQKQLITDLEELRKTHALVQNEQLGSVAELENAKGTLRKVEKERTQLHLVVEVHEETNREMRREIDHLRSTSVPTE